MEVFDIADELHTALDPNNNMIGPFAVGAVIQMASQRAVQEALDERKAVVAYLEERGIAECVISKIAGGAHRERGR